MQAIPWNTRPPLDALNEMLKNTLSEQLDMRITALTDLSLEATMPVDHRTVQPMGLLHGGASAALAETLGSIAAYLCIDRQTQKGIAGVELSVSHLRAATEGRVTGVATAIKLGRRTQVWNIRIHDEKDRDIAVARLTTMVI